MPNRATPLIEDPLGRGKVFALQLSRFTEVGASGAKYATDRRANS